jgi:hypothetical protein
MSRAARFIATAVVVASSGLLGACQGDATTAPRALSPDAALATKGQSTVAVCHALGNGRFQSVSVAPSAVAAHMNHGDATFAGYWPSSNAVISSTGTTFVGQWDRPDFYGVLIDGCTASVTFPDDAVYQGTLVGTNKIQWSYAGTTETNPDNYWVR